MEADETRQGGDRGWLQLDGITEEKKSFGLA